MWTFKENQVCNQAIHITEFCASKKKMEEKCENEKKEMRKQIELQVQGKGHEGH